MTSVATKILEKSKALGGSFNEVLSPKKNYFRSKRIEYLEHYHRSNQDTCLVHKPAVNSGEWVESGDLLADCSASMNGELAIGKNILVAYMPWEGFNYEDAILINERLVYDDVYTSIHIERYEIETKENQLGADQITREIPDISPESISHLDNTGIAKIGSWIEEGDILVGKVTPINKKDQTPYQRLLFKLLDKKVHSVRDSSLRAPKGIKANVINVQILAGIDSSSVILNKTTSSKKAKQKKNSLGHGILDTVVSEVSREKKDSSSKRSTSTSINTESLQKLQLNLARFSRANPNSISTTTSIMALPLHDRAIMTREKNSIYKYKYNSEHQKGSAVNFKTWLMSFNIDYINSHKQKDFCFLPLAIAEGDSPRINQDKALNINRNCLNTECFGEHQKYKVNHVLKDLSVCSNQKRFLPRYFNTAYTHIKKNTFQKKLSLTTHFDSHQNSIPALMASKSATANKLVSVPKKKEKELLLRNSTQGKRGIFNGIKKQKIIPTLVHIYLAEKRKIQVGDKMAGRHGNKGIISNILPREDMPFLPDGSPIDIVLNPLGVPSRMNVGQIYECLLGLAGKYLGEHFKIFPFDEIYGPEASRSFVFAKLFEARQKTGIEWLFDANSPGKIRIFDGRTCESFDQPVTVGIAYMLKLVHMVDDKIHARSTGPYSLVTQQPLRGRAKQGGQRLGEMEVWAIEGYGAAFVLLEMLTIKSDDMTGRLTLWSNLILNKEIKIGTPESFKVLVCELQALCLDIGLFHASSNIVKHSDNTNQKDSQKPLLLQEISHLMLLP